MPLPVTFATLATGNQPASLLDQNFAAVANMATTYCTATGTNAILLSVAPNQPTPTGYANGQQFSFLVPATNTGAVTIQVGSLAAIPLRAAGQPLAAGALIAGTACDVVVSGGGTSADLVGGSGAASGAFLPLTGGTLSGPLTVNGKTIIQGTATNDSAAAGFVGEVISSNVTTGVTLTTAVGANVTSISLTAGDWNVQGEAWFSIGTGGATTIIAGINAVSATIAGASALGSARSQINATLTASTQEILALRTTWISLASTTTIYLIAQANFPSGTITVTGNIWARRAR